jgi:phosphate transport system permease protein
MRRRALTDAVAGLAMRLLAVGVLTLALVVVMGLLYRSYPIWGAPGGLATVVGEVWHPAQGQFGLLTFLLGSLWVTGLAMLIAVPLSLLTAMYLSEYASRRLQALVAPVVDVLAGISPVVYGVWGVLVVVPLVRDRLIPIADRWLRFAPFRTENYTGYSALAGGIVLAIMVSPLIISIVTEVLRVVPAGVREASLALGATRWETTRRVVLGSAWPGVVAAVILALSRAFGETMAVLMVSGCALHVLPRSVFDPAYPLPALIANTYGELLSIPRYDAAVLLAALVLLLVTLLFNLVGWSILVRLERRLA